MHMHICTALLVHALAHALSFALVITLIASPAPPRLACLSRRIASLHWLKHHMHHMHNACMHMHICTALLVHALVHALSFALVIYYTNRLARSASPCMLLAPHRDPTQLASCHPCHAMGLPTHMAGMAMDTGMHTSALAHARVCPELCSGHYTVRLASSAQGPPRSDVKSWDSCEFHLS